MNDLGEFQEVESKYSGRLSYVSSQPVMIPSSRSMLSRDKRLQLDTWNTSGLQENNFLRVIHPEIILKQIQSDDVQRNREAVPEAGRTKTVLTSEDRLNHGTIPMPTFAGRPSTVSPLIQVEFPQNSTVGQQRQQIAELQFDKFPNPQSFLVWKIRFKNQVTTCGDFPSDAWVWIKEVEMVDSLNKLKSSCMERIFQNLRCWTRKLILL